MGEVQAMSSSTLPTREQAPASSSYVGGYAPYGAAYGAGPSAPNGGHYAAAAPAAPLMPEGAPHTLPAPFHHGHHGYHGPYGYGGHYGGHGYGGHAIVHAERVANTEASARASDLHFAEQERRRNDDLLLSDNFERRLRELEEPVRDLKSVCEQRVTESRELSSRLLPAATGPARADLNQIR